MQASSVVSLSPSFNSYSNSNLAEIAARVAEEYGYEEFYDEFYFESEENPATTRTKEEENSEYVDRERATDVFQEEDGDEEEEFEFPFLSRETEFPSPISADEIFHNGQIRPVYPVFNRDLFLKRAEFPQNGKDEKGTRNPDSEKGPTIRLPLRKLFIEERETTMTMTRTSSSSSSEADELNGLPGGLLLRLAAKGGGGERCKKSSSAGSNSKRWKFKDLLHRSHSDGSKGNLVILSPSNSGRKKQNEESGKVAPVSSSGKVKSPAPPLPPPAAYNRDGGEKRRSYLPYRQDLVGLFGNVNGLSRHLQPF